MSRLSGPDWYAAHPPESRRNGGWPAAAREARHRGKEPWTPEKQRACAKRSRERHPERARIDTLTKYGLTIERYDALLAKQGGACAICGREQGVRALAVDHDHRCCPGKKSCGRCIRGLLCSQCNHAIGLMGDSPARLTAAIFYLADCEVYAP